LKIQPPAKYKKSWEQSGVFKPFYHYDALNDTCIMKQSKGRKHGCEERSAKILGLSPWCRRVCRVLCPVWCVL